MKHESGFTLIEIVLLIVVVGMLSGTIVSMLLPIAKGTPAIIKNSAAAQSARQCMEWFIGQRNLNGYSSVPCPSSSVPTFCQAASGFSIAAQINCTTISGDSGYKTVTITVSGAGDATLTTLLADY